MAKGRHRANASDLQKVIDELTAFVDEFDVSDPEGMQVLLDEHISNLMSVNVITKKRRGTPQLEDVLKDVLGGDAIDDFLERAETFRQLIDSYGDAPSDDDMEEAFNLLDELVNDLRKKLPKVKANE